MCLRARHMSCPRECVGIAPRPQLRDKRILARFGSTVSTKGGLSPLHNPNCGGD